MRVPPLLPFLKITQLVPHLPTTKTPKLPTSALKQTSFLHFSRHFSKMATRTTAQDEEMGMTSERTEMRFNRRHNNSQNFTVQGRLSVWEVLGIVSTFRQNVERMKLYRATLSVIRFMAVLNFIYTVVGSAFLIIGLSPKVYEAMEIGEPQSAQFLRFGKQISNREYIFRSPW